MNYPVTIITAVVDKHNLTMYTSEGETITVPQGDPRIRDLVKKCVDAGLSAGKTMTLTAEDMAGKNAYADVEKKSNGLVRFFKMAKSKLKEIAEKFCEPVAPQTFGPVPVPKDHPTVVQCKVAEGMTIEVPVEPEAPVLPPVEERPLTKSEQAVAEIMANAVPSSDKNFEVVKDKAMAKKDGTEEEVVVAVLNDGTVIPGVEQLEDQLKAVTAGVTSVDGMQLFLNRAASVKRGHSVEDLLKFVQKGELPFADDGTVLVYKRLSSTDTEGVYVDVHSGRVKQRVGSFVHMAEHMVDPRRSQDCSNGLHVARRDYLTAFSGDVTVLCKLAPEDVIAVPSYDARKLRAKGYHIVAVLSKEDAALVCSNKPMSDTKLLADCIAGNHAPILEYVEITEQKGGGLKITPAGEVGERPVYETREVSSLDHLPEVSAEAATVDAKAIAVAVVEPKEQLVQAPPAGMDVKSDPLPTPVTPPPMPVAAVKPNPVPNKSPAQKLVDAFNEASTPSAKALAARDLVDFKKSKKKSWTALSIPTPVWTKALEIVEALDAGAKNAVTKADLKPEVEAIAKTLPKTKPSNDDKALKAMAKPATTGSAKAPSKQQIAKPAKAKAKTTTRDTFEAKGSPLPEGKKTKMTQQEQMAALVKLYEKNPDKANARAIYAFKQKSKKSWEVLGVTDKKFQAKITERAKL